MAASGSGGGAPPFSIRGYAARARAGAADEGDRCWPLGGEAGPLPPIEVRWFRWWADEAAVAKELVVEEEEEERRKAAMCRKRSVVELFAAVPRVAGGGEERRVRRKLDKGKLAAGVLAKKESKKDKAPPERKKGGLFGIIQAFQEWWRRIREPRSLGCGPTDARSTLTLSRL